MLSPIIQTRNGGESFGRSPGWNVGNECLCKPIILLYLCICHKATYQIEMSTRGAIFSTLLVYDLIFISGAGGGVGGVAEQNAAKPVTAVWGCISGFESVKPLDFFNEWPWRDTTCLPFVCVPLLDICKDTSGQFPVMFVATTTRSFCKKSEHLEVCLWWLRPFPNPYKPFFFFFCA